MPYKLAYNYPDLSEINIFTPTWGKKISQDIPFKDGLSGAIDITITAKTPICVGGVQNNDSAPKETYFYQLPNETYAIPWSSVKGMTRTLMKAMTYGRANQVDEEYSGVRRPLGNRNSSDYNRARDDATQIGYGFIQNNNGKLTLKECKKAYKVPYQELTTALGASSWEISVKEKYEQYDNAEYKYTENGQSVVISGNGEIEGKLVFVTHFGTDNRKKAHDFLFCEEKTPVPLTEKQFKRFQGAYSNEGTKTSPSKSKCPWQFHWKEKFKKGAEVPVFLYKDADGEIKHISMTVVPKFASLHSTHDMLNNIDEAHLKAIDFDESNPDLAECIFGFIADNNINLKGRVSGTPFRYQGDNPCITKTPSLVLLKPRSGHPSTRIQQPDAVKQEVGRMDRVPPENDKTFFTPLSSSDHNPRLRIFNRYYTDKSTLTPNNHQANNNLDRKLHTLPKDSTFTGKLRFHNLKKAELGALLWMLNWGGDENCWHNLGGGKPYRYGAVTIKATLQNDIVFNNRDDTSTVKDDEFVKTFIEVMNENEKEGEWENSPRVKSIKSIADPSENKNLKPSASSHPYPDFRGYNEMENNRAVLPKV